MNNLPVNQSTSNKFVDPTNDQTLDILNTYYSVPTPVNQNDLQQLTAFFEERKFQSSAAVTLASSLAVQAGRDGYSISGVLDTLRNLSDLEIASLLGELLNFNRLNTSFLGTKNLAPPFELVARHVQP